MRLPYNVNVLTAAAARVRAARAREVLDAQTQRIVAERARLERGARRASPACARFPSAANFILARVADAPTRVRGA